MSAVPLLDAPVPPPPTRRLSPRLTVLLVSGVSSLVLALVIALLPVPYVIFSPGPVQNTLGTDSDGREHIRIEGVTTYPTSGSLSLTTITVTGGPLGHLSIGDIVAAWLDPTRSVRPAESVYPPERSREEAEQESAAEMQSAQQSAAVVAIEATGRTVPVTLRVGGTSAGLPAADALQADDVITAADGAPLPAPQDLVDAIERAGDGGTVTLTLRRDNATLDVDVAVVTRDGRAVIGVVLDPQYDLPFEVDYDVGRIGGPSAGLMFTLGIYDKLTPGELTGGQAIAGTGTIADDGSVGPIDGIQQKMAGAAGDGARWFLVPRANCPDTAGAVPDGLRDVVVDDFAGARDAVEAIGAGDGAALPHCS